MEVIKAETKKHTVQRKKYHQELSVELEEKKLALQEKYSDINKAVSVIDQIEERDVLMILDDYSKSLELDLYHIAESFHISPVTLNKVLTSDKYKEAYEIAKERRSAVYEREGYHVAQSPWKKIQNGEEVSMVEVAAAKLLSNYCLAVSQASAKKNSSEGGVSVVVNTGISLKI